MEGRNPRKNPEMEGGRMKRCPPAAALGFLLLPVCSTLAAAPINLSKHRSFADDITETLYALPNEVSSSLGISMALGLIYPGCTGESVTQLEETLGFPPSDSSHLPWKDTSDQLSGADGSCQGEIYDGRCYREAPTLKIANSVWFHTANALDPEYRDTVGPDIVREIFASAASPALVNDWVKNQTNGLINSIVSQDRPLYPPHELIAVNTIYFKAAWVKPFMDHSTNLDKFYSSVTRSKEASRAYFMHTVSEFPYSHTIMPGYQVVRLPFANSQISFVVVLPMNDDSSETPVKSSSLLPLLSNMDSTRVALGLPKFKFGSEYSDRLKDAIKQTGIVAPFSGGSLCRLFRDDDTCQALFITEIIQKTVIDVNEKGVEAAAATAVMVGRTALPTHETEPVLMLCDHPFQFFIYHESEELVLFEGRVGMPELPDAVDQEPRLKSKHNDEDFWERFGVEPISPRFEAEDSSGSSPTLRKFLFCKKGLVPIAAAFLAALILHFIL